MNDDYSWLEEPLDSSESSPPASPQARRGWRRFLPRLRRGSSQTASPPSATELLRRHNERPTDQLDDRLQALRNRNANPDLTGDRDELYDIDQALTAPSLQDKPGGIISAVALSQGQQQQVDLLRELASGQTNQPQRPMRRRVTEGAGGALRDMPRLLISALLLVFVALPYVSSDYAPDALPPRNFGADDPQGAALFATLDALAPGDFALVAVEYGLGAAAELDPLTDLALRHILARGATPVLATSNPTAFVHVQNRVNSIRNSVANDGLYLADSRDFLLLRYLPGGTPGLRELSENFADIARISQKPASTVAPLRSLDDLALMLLIAESADDVRNWVEQVLPETTTPLLAATSKTAEPLARAYATSLDGLRGFVAGYAAAQTYGAKLDAAFGAPPPLAPAATPLPTTTPMPTPLPTLAPTPTATPAMTLMLRVTAQSPVDFRVGPSINQVSIATANPGDEFAALDANNDATWYKALLPNGWEGWIQAIHIETFWIAQTPPLSDLAAQSRLDPPQASLFSPTTRSPQPIIAQRRQRGGEAQRSQAMTMGGIAAVIAIALGNLVAAIGAFGRRK